MKKEQKAETADVLKEFYKKMNADARFTKQLENIELHDDSDGVVLSIDFHGVADFTWLGDEKRFAICLPHEFQPMLDYLNFLEENGIKKFNEVTFFGEEGTDRLQVIGYESTRRSLAIDEVKWLVKAMAGHERL